MKNSCLKVKKKKEKDNLVILMRCNFELGMLFFFSFSKEW